MKITLYVKWREPNKDAGYRRLASFLTCALRSGCNLMILKELLVIFVTLTKKSRHRRDFFSFHRKFFIRERKFFSQERIFFCAATFLFHRAVKIFSLRCVTLRSSRSPRICGSLLRPGNTCRRTSSRTEGACAGAFRVRRASRARVRR